VSFIILILKEIIMSDSNSIASAAHKDAATEHKACADQHTKAASCHDNNKVGDAKTCSSDALKASDAAHQKSVKACDSSSK
jgi:hypothetical protein